MVSICIKSLGIYFGTQNEYNTLENHEQIGLNNKMAGYHSSLKNCYVAMYFHTVPLGKQSSSINCMEAFLFCSVP